MKQIGQASYSGLIIRLSAIRTRNFAPDPEIFSVWAKTDKLIGNLHSNFFNLKRESQRGQREGESKCKFSVVCTVVEQIKCSLHFYVVSLSDRTCFLGS